MSHRCWRTLSVAAPALLCIFFATSAALSAVGFDGVLIRGLTSDIGNVRRGHAFDQYLSIYNLTLNRISLTVVPTCGCALNGPVRLNAPPLSVTRVVVPYRIRRGAAGRYTRHAIIDYDIGSAHRRFIARVTLRLSE